MPLAFQAISRLGVGPWETLAQRILWSVPTALVFVLAAGQGPQVRRVLGSPRIAARLALTAALITLNWAVYIWAVTHGRLLEASLGYYINPLLNMAAGALLFHERIDGFGRTAMALAVVGVVIQTVALGHPPFVSIVLALSFAGYGVVRKQVDADAQTGLFIETVFLLPFCLIFIGWLTLSGAGHFDRTPETTLWLLASGPITAVPLVLFSWAARRLPLSAMGFLQFLAPTIAFAIGVLQGEAFSPLRALSFVFIWGGAAIFIAGAWRRSRSLTAR